MKWLYCEFYSVREESGNQLSIYISGTAINTDLQCSGCLEPSSQMLLLFFKTFLVISPQASSGQNESSAELQIKPSLSLFTEQRYKRIQLR